MKPWVDVTDPRVVKALAHPVRVRILSMLDESVLSPSEIAGQIDVPIGNVSYHTRQLLELGMIKLVRETKRRGAVEHHYTAEARPMITDDAWREAPEIVRQAMVGAALQESAKAVNAAAISGGFSRDGAHLSRIPTPVDERGWKQMSNELAKMMIRLQRIAEASQARVRDADHVGERHATAVMMLFEDMQVAPEMRPPRRDQARRRATRRASSKS
jgi:DNA-binding transcriptional ArsR family regulator